MIPGTPAFSGVTKPLLLIYRNFRLKVDGSFTCCRSSRRKAITGLTGEWHDANTSILLYRTDGKGGYR